MRCMFRLDEIKRDACECVYCCAHAKLGTRGTEKFSAFMRKFNSELTHVGTININLPEIFSVIYNFGTRTTDNAPRESCVLNL